MQTMLSKIGLTLQMLVYLTNHGVKPCLTALYAYYELYEVMNNTVKPIERWPKIDWKECEVAGQWKVEQVLTKVLEFMSLA